VIPVELELRNFLAYKDPGPLRLEGIHVACLAGPNGAGKSTILDAITWALWGKARSNSPDALIHQGETEMRVALVFDLSGLRYRVIRQRKAGKRGASLLELQAWDEQTNSWRTLSENTMRATQERIEKLLKLDYDTFVNSAFLMQGRADEFTTKTPNQRKQVLANILGLDQWEIYETRAKEQINSTREAMGRIRGRLEEIDRELGRRQEYERALREAQHAADQVAQRLRLAEAQLAAAQQARAHLDNLLRQEHDLAKRLKARQGEIQESKAQRERLLAQADPAALQAALQTVRQELAGLEEVQEELSRLEKDRAALGEEMATLQGINQALGPETEPLKERLATLKETTQPLCPTCGQPLTESHRAELVADLEAQIAQRRDTYRANRERIRQLEKRLQGLSQDLRQLTERLKGRALLQKRAGELEAAIQHADQAASQAAELGGRIERWEKEVGEEQARLKTLKEEIEALRSKLAHMPLDPSALDQLRLEKRLADERVGGARQQLAALEALSAQRQNLQAEHRRLAEDLALYEDLREAFSKRGVPAMIIETVVPELERAANELLARMTEGRMHVRIETQRETKTGALREALDIIISDDLGSRPYEMYSGGEAFRIDFALRIALSRLLARRAGAQLRSLFIDEGFGSQDARGRENLVAAINSIQDDFDRILVITHIDELKDAFPARIEVFKTSEGSQFRLA
jgi:exonuclease SbcC